jgi:hypothetical protein
MILTRYNINLDKVFLITGLIRKINRTNKKKLIRGGV